MRLAKPSKLSVVFLKFVEEVLLFQSRGVLLTLKVEGPGN